MFHKGKDLLDFSSLLVSVLFLSILSITTDGFATSDLLRKPIANCEDSGLKVTAYLDDANDKIDKIVYMQKREIFNPYTNQIDVYMREGSGRLTSYIITDSAVILYLDGVESYHSPYREEIFELAHISLMPNELWIERKTGSPWRHTIHPSCKYFNLDLLEIATD